MPTQTEIEYISEEEVMQAEHLASCIAELMSNWMENNRPRGRRAVDVSVLLAGLGRMINMIIGGNPCSHCRERDSAMIIDMILGYSNVERESVMALLAIIGDVGEKRGRLDA